MAKDVVSAFLAALEIEFYLKYKLEHKLFYLPMLAKLVLKLLQLCLYLFQALH